MIGIFSHTWEFGGHPQEHFQKLILISCNVRQSETIFVINFLRKLWKSIFNVFEIKSEQGMVEVSSHIGVEGHPHIFFFKN